MEGWSTIQRWLAEVYHCRGASLSVFHSWRIFSCPLGLALQNGLVQQFAPVIPGELEDVHTDNLHLLPDGDQVFLYAGQLDQRIQ